MTHLVKVLEKLGCALVWRWKCIYCQVTLESENSGGLKCPTCGKAMMNLGSK